MFWLLSLIVCAIFAAVAMAVRRRWITPWRQVEHIVDDIRHVRTPRTYLIEGNEVPRRVALALEEIFTRQRELARENVEHEFSVQAILGAMADGLAIVDRKTAIRLTNASFCKMFDVGDEVIGMTPIEALRNLPVAQLVIRTLESGESAGDAITLHRRSQTQELEVTASAVRDNADAVSGAIVLFRDVTRNKENDTMRRDFVANVSHELRTPLSIVHGYLEALREDESMSGDERARIIDVMQKHSRRLNLLVEDLLSLSRLETSQPRLEFGDMDLREFLPAIVAEWNARFAAKKLTHEIDIAADLPLIRGDETRLQEVIYNLLDNAVKYSSEGGAIRIAAHKCDDRVELTVSDQGRGIPTADLPRVFERFYRVDKSRSSEVAGTGLGLSIVKHIVQLHGGRVEAQSAFGEGTTMRVFLPIKVGAIDLNRPDE